MRVLALDGINLQGLEIMREAGMEVVPHSKMNEAELIEALKEGYDALLVRSGTKVTAPALDAAKNLKIIGRAGVGTDNIDLEAATERGIVVVNAPGGNTIAAAEHTVAMMMALMRNIPQANANLKQGKWEKKKYVGVELRGKTLGIIGLGKIGREVARRALGLEMRVLVHDPHINPEQLRPLEVDLVSKEQVFRESDLISFHLPLTEDTRHMLGYEELKSLKPGARVLNVARGGIIDEEALYKVLQEGHLAGAALDVFEKEPLKTSPLQQMDNVILTPHLGASTEEAQVAVATEVAQDVIRCLSGEPVFNAVNIPVLRGQLAKVLQPYLQLAEKLGSFIVQLMESPILAVEINFNGELAEHDLATVTNSFLKGLLRPLLGDAVNYVNAPLVAKKRGIRIQENKSQEMKYFANLITVKVEGRRESHTLAGTVNQNGESRIVSLGGYSVDAHPAGHMVVVLHEDRPRIVGPTALIIGDRGVNIAGMQMGRRKKGGEAVMLLNIDSEIMEEDLKAIRQVDGVLDVRYIHL